jgi:type 1 glutamine amidotransferase
MRNQYNRPEKVYIPAMSSLSNLHCVWLLSLATVTSCHGSPAGPDPVQTATPAPSQSAAAARVLVVSHTAGFRHSSIPIAEQTIEQLGRSSGAYQTSFCRTADDVRSMLTPAGLANVDAVVFANTTGNLGVPDLGAFLGWIASGKGFAGFHSASDTYHDSPAFLEMLGNEFDTHGKQTEIEAVVEQASHQAVAHVAPRYRVFDEIYRFKSNNRSNVTPLLTLDRYPRDGLAREGEPGDLPLAWARSHGTGRVFYTALGHREELWADKVFQQHVLGGIRAVLGR